MKIRNNHILIICVLALALVCFFSVDGPIRFSHQQTVREKAVKEYLVKIRLAEENYRKATGVYSGDFATLIRGRFMADSLQYVPYGGKTKFQLRATTQISKSGRQIPLMECSAGYRDYLKGLDDNNITNLTESAENSGRFPGLKIGDITTPNNNAGNWE